MKQKTIPKNKGLKERSNVINVNFQTQTRSTTETMPKALKNKKRRQKIDTFLYSSKTKSSQVIDLIPKINEERRKKCRIVMSGLMNTAIVGPQGLNRDVFLKDISETGISFDLPLKFSEAFKVKEKLSIRFYLNPEDYFDFDISVTKNIRDIPEEGVCRYGCKFELKNNEESKKVINNLIHFIKSVSTILHKDRGEILLHK